MVSVNYYLSNKWNLTSSVDSDGDGNVDNLDAHPTDPNLGGKTTYVENFNDFVAGDLEGQNNWKVIKQYTSNGIQVVSDFGPDGSTALQFPYSGSGVQNSGYKIFDQIDDPLPFTNATQFTFEIEMNKICWGSYFFLTYDENGNSQYDTGEDGIGIMLDAGCSGDKLKITKGDGQTIETSALGSGWFKIRFEMDLSANSGQGSGNVLFKSLTDGDTTWNEISEFQNFNLALDPNATTAVNPYNWDGIRVHFVGKTGGLDNMILEYQ